MCRNAAGGPYRREIALSRGNTFAIVSIYCIIFADTCHARATKSATMINIAPVIYAHHRRKDGTYPVKIRITFHRERRYLATTIFCKANDLTRTLKPKAPAVVARINSLCDRLRSEAAKINPFDLEGRSIDWVVARLTEDMRREDFRLDFFVWAEQFLRTKSEGNRAKYETALRAFERFLGKRAIDINDISHALLVEFAEACDAGPKMAWSSRAGRVVESSKPRTGKISPHYLAHLCHIYDGAKDRYNDEDAGVVLIPRSPFRKLDMTPPRPTTAQEPLPVEVLQTMIDDAGCTPAQRRSLDIFVVGFALMGANLADLWEAVPPRGGWWGYNRRKTRNRRADGAFIRCAIPPEIGPFLARLGAGRSASWWLPVLRSLGKDAAIAGQTVNRNLRSWCEARGFPPFTYYACRHSWATYARRLGIEKATVDEALGHVGDFRITDIYAERDWERIADASRRVLSMFRWPTSLY